MESEAVEHTVWCAENDFTPREVIESVGLDWPSWKKPTWDDAVFAVQMARTRLARKQLEAIEDETRAMMSAQ